MPSESRASFEYLSEQLCIECSIATVSALEKLLQEFLECEYKELKESSFSIIVATLIKMFNQHDKTVSVSSLQLLILAWFQDQRHHLSEQNFALLVLCLFVLGGFTFLLIMGRLLCHRSQNCFDSIEQDSMLVSMSYLQCFNKSLD